MGATLPGSFSESALLEPRCTGPAATRSKFWALPQKPRQSAVALESRFGGLRWMSSRPGFTPIAFETDAWSILKSPVGCCIPASYSAPAPRSSKVDRGTLIHKIQQGDVSAVMKALPVLGNIDEPLTSIGQTALHLACAAGALPLVTALMKQGANANATDKTGASCVALASTAGHAHVLEKTLARKQAQHEQGFVGVV